QVHTNVETSSGRRGTLIPDSLNMIPDSGFPTTDSLNGSEEVSSSLNQIQKLYFDTLGTVITKHNLETIMTYLEDGLTEWHICRALELTSENNKRSFKYTMGILNNWLQQRAFTPEAVKLLELEHQKRGSPNQKHNNPNTETAAERLLREEIERERAEGDIIDIAWSEGG
ncbi:MAG: DnaD domain-containing protein, partial [Christensenellales bacterium]